TIGRQGILFSFRAAFRARDLTYRHEPLATLGDSLLLCRVFWSASGFAGRQFDVGAYEREEIAVIDVDASGRRRSAETFATDRWADAVARLYERYAELLPEGPAHVRATVTARSVGACAGLISVDRYAAACSADVEYVDHRTIGFEPTRGVDAFLRGLRSL